MDHLMRLLRFLGLLILSTTLLLMFFHPWLLKLNKINLKVMSSTMFGMTHICGISTTIKLFTNASQTMKYSMYFTFVMSHQLENILTHNAQGKGSQTMVSIGPCFSKTHGRSHLHVSNVKDNELLSLVGNKCPNNLYCSMKFFMCRVLILWDHSLFLLALHIFYLLWNMSPSVWRLQPLELMMFELLWILSGLTFFVGLESIEPLSVIKELISTIGHQTL